ncbi:hypothetical protein LguiB_017176 [Lonicera macranthoides]
MPTLNILVHFQAFTLFLLQSQMGTIDISPIFLNHQIQMKPTTKHRLLSLSLGSQKSLTSNLTCPQSYLNSAEETTFSPNTYYGTESFSIGSSKYWKPAQSLLEEVVIGGGKECDLSNEKYVKRLSPAHKKGSLGPGSELKANLFNNGSLLVEKQELQAKLAKVNALLEEVEIRFDQYYTHFEQMVSSFEVMTGAGAGAGAGAGKSYTTLALQAMSRHFCSLRESIVSQIYATKGKISLEMPRISLGLLQLRLFDQENRHSLASLQQLGIIHSTKQTYPNDIEKLMLASQTGLSKNQVSNWFINARIRLWKPMIEEMYKEEFQESEDDSINPLLAGSSITSEGVIITDHEED